MAKQRAVLPKLYEELNVLTLVLRENPRSRSHHGTRTLNRSMTMKIIRRICRLTALVYTPTLASLDYI